MECNCDKKLMEVGKDYTSHAGNRVTCIGYDDDKCVVKYHKRYQYQDRYRSVIGIVGGGSCDWVEYVEPKVEMKLLHISKTHLGNGRKPNVEVTYTDDVLTNIRLI